MLPLATSSRLAQCDLDSDSCTFPPRPLTKITLLFSALPFIVTFSAVFIGVLHRLFPLLCGPGTRHQASDGRLRRRISALAFSTTLGATGVLAELILCEVGGWLRGDARQLAFRIAVGLLLACLIVVVPFLQIYSLIASASWDRRSHLVSTVIGFSTWLWVFWICGDWIPIAALNINSDPWVACRFPGDD
jgi:hypothetical protein